MILPRRYKGRLIRHGCIFLWRRRAGAISACFCCSALVWAASQRTALVLVADQFRSQLWLSVTRRHCPLADGLALRIEAVDLVFHRVDVDNVPALVGIGAIKAHHHRLFGPHL